MKQRTVASRFTAALVLGALLFLLALMPAPAAPPAPKISISWLGVEIANGDTTPTFLDGTDFLTAPVGTTGGSFITYTITNKGNAPLTLTGTPQRVKVSGPHVVDFLMLGDGQATPIAPGGTASIVIVFHPTISGLQTATVSVESDDPDQPTFTFAIQGTGVFIPGVAVGLSTTLKNTLVNFDPAIALNWTQNQTVTGVVDGEELVALDKAPANDALLALGVDAAKNQGTLYTLDPVTGIATPIGAPGRVAFVDLRGNAVTLAANVVDMDVNPVTGEVRVVTTGGLNFRIDPVSGQPIDGDLGLNGRMPGVNPDGPINGPAGLAIAGAAHTNSFPGAAATTLYTVSERGIFFIQNPPDSGTTTNPTAPRSSGDPLPGFSILGLDMPANVVAANSNRPAPKGYAYVTLVTDGGQPRAGRLDLATGELTLTAYLPEIVRSLALLSTPREPPAVPDFLLTHVTKQSAMIGGVVEEDSSAPIYERGVVIARTSDTADPRLGQPNVRKFTGGTLTGIFLTLVNGLDPDTQYSCRTYATNVAGTTYTPVSTFTTLGEVDFQGVDETAITTRGETRIYPLANEVPPTGAPLQLLGVSDPAILIDGRSLIIPASYEGTFTYLFSDGAKTGQASVTVTRGTPANRARVFSGLLRLTSVFRLPSVPVIVGSADVTISPNGRVASLVLKTGPSIVRRLVVFPAGSMTATRETPLGTVTLTRNADGTVTCQLAVPDVIRGGVLQARHAAGAPRRYHVALAGTYTHPVIVIGDPPNPPYYPPTVPGGGFAIVHVLANGSVLVTSVLPNGSSFSAATSLRENETISFFSAVRRGVRAPVDVAGEMVLADLPTTDLTGEWIWADTILTANGSLYRGQIPAAGTGVLELSGGDVPGQRSTVTVTAGRPDAVAALERWIVYPRSGIFLAGVRIPGLPRASLGRGLYLPKSQTAWGYFPGKTTGGRISLSQP
ncbi:MAG TPA: DUF4394 domain-containing protein [Chthoniobacteraceae bacterium]|nr:DUF4394 domain-containing protein [Chthoniobacteraceae bacterium]